MHDASSDDGTGAPPARGRRRATGRATLAGVSPITASRVVAGKTTVRPELAERVRVAV